MARRRQMMWHFLGLLALSAACAGTDIPPCDGCGLDAPFEVVDSGTSFSEVIDAGTFGTGGSAGAGGSGGEGGSGGQGGSGGTGGSGGSGGGGGNSNVTSHVLSPAWTASPSTQPPYSSGASKLIFVDDTQFVASLGTLSSSTGKAPFTVFDGYVTLFSRAGVRLRELASLSRTTMSLAVSADKSKVAAGSLAGGAIRVASLNPADAGSALELKAGIGVNALAFSPDGQSLFAGGTEQYFDPPPLRRFDLATKGQVASVPIQSFYIVGIAVNAAGDNVAVASTGSPTSATAKSRQTVMRATDLKSLLVTAAPDYVAFVKDPRTGALFTATSNHVMGVPVRGERIIVAAPHPTLPKAATLHFDGMLRLVNLSTGVVEDEVRANVQAYDVAFSPDGSRVVAAGIQPSLAAFDLVPGNKPWTAPASLCGNGVVDVGEFCDGAPSATCAAVGYTQGALKCTSACRLDVSSCIGRLSGWSCTKGAPNDGVCDCGCDVPDPDCGPSQRASACERSACANGTQPALAAPWTCTIDSCANLSPEGRCNNGVLEGCDDKGVLQRIYCSSYAASASSSACLANAGTPTCRAGLGKACVVSAGGFSTVLQCEGTDSACVYSGLAGGACRSGYAQCDSNVPVCLGADKLQVSCRGGQPMVMDCLALGTVCMNGKCQ